MTTLSELFDSFNAAALKGAGSPGAKPVDPLAQPVQPMQSAQPQQLPKVAAPIQPMQSAQPVSQPYIRPSPVPVSSSKSTQSIDTVSRGELATSGQRQDAAYNEQVKYIEDLGAAQGEAKDQVNQEMGSPEQKVKDYQDSVSDAKDQMKADMVELDTKIQDLKSSEFKDFWADKSTGTKIAMALAVGLGQYGAMMTGSKNVAWDIVQKAMDDDYRMQEANFNRKLKNIEVSKLGIDQKQKLIDIAHKDFDTYQVARSYAVEQKAEKIMRDNGQELSPALQDAYQKIQQDKEKNAQGLISAKANKIINQTNSAIPQSQITPDLANKMSTDANSSLGKYNKSVDDYQQMQNFRKSGNYNASVIQLIATGLKQNSYNPNQFDTTTRSLFEKWRDSGFTKQLGKGEEQIIVKAAEKYFEESVKSSYDEVKSQIPMFKSLASQHTAGQNSELYVKPLPRDLLNKTQDLSKSGLKKAP